MFATALIVFRETLEAALFIGIVAAATRGVLHRWGWLGAGVASGVLGAVALALGAEQLSSWADGLGQDVLNAGILSVALVMLAWHCIWVSTHGREMAQEAKQLAHHVSGGDHAPWMLTVVIGLCVLREGAETVLFVLGFASGPQAQTGNVAVGAGLGLLAGIALGVVLYWGLSKIKPHKLFAVTNGLMLLLAASMASQLARTLSQAGWLTFWSDALWDSSWLLSSESAVGTLLHALMGYDAHPSGLQLAFYAAALLLIGGATRWVEARRHPPQRLAAAAG